MRLHQMLTISAVLLFSCSLARADEGRELIRIDLPVRERLQPLIDNGFDLWVVDRHSVTAYASDDEKAWLLSQDYDFASEQHVLDPYLQDRRAQDGYFTLAEYESAIRDWTVNYSDIVTSFSIGQTENGRDLWMLKISDNVLADEDEPKAVMLSLQHAREWLSGMTLHGITNHIITTYGADSRTTNLVDNMELYVLLVANPDGYSYTHTNDRLWRKNRRNNGNGTFGVDLNRNFPYAWTLTGGSSSSTYGGPSPTSELETQALINFILDRKPAGLLNYHTYGTRVMHNWAYTFDLPSNKEMMGDLAFGMAQEIENVNGQTFRNGSWAVALDYTGGGATVDYTHASLGIPSFTLELRPTSEDPAGFVPPGTSIAPSVSENIQGALYYLEWVLGQATDATAPVLTDVEVFNISSTEASVRWKTDDPSTREVEYGTTASYGSTLQPDKLRDQAHLIRITGLTPATEYHVRAKSLNLAGLESVSNDIAFTTTATAQDITPPTYSAITIIRRVSPTMMEMTWEHLSSGLAGIRLYESADEGETWTLLRDETQLSAAMTSVQLPAPPKNELRWYYITAVDNSPNKNESIPSDVYAFRTSGLPAKILLVDGFDSWGSMNESDGANHDFTAVHGSSISTFGESFDVCANQAIGAGVSLNDYSAVVWMLGTESTGGEKFSNAEQAAVRAFLENGGRLFVSGSEIGWDLWNRGTSSDRSFYTNYLNASYSNDDFNTFATNGQAGTIFESMEVKFDDGSRRIYRVDTPDGIGAANGSTVVLRSINNNGAGVHRRGTFGSGTHRGHVVMLSFPFETIYPRERRDEVMRAVLSSFELGPHGWMLRE